MKRPDSRRIFDVVRCSVVAVMIGMIGLSQAGRCQESVRSPGSRTVDPGAILTSRGLTRVGNLYMLKAEVDAGDAMKQGEEELDRMEGKAQELRQAVAEEQVRLAVMDQQLSAQQQEREGLNTQKQTLNDQYASAQDQNSQTFYKNQIQQIDNQIQGKQDEINRLNQSFVFAQNRLQDQVGTVRQLETDYETKLAAYERTFGYVKEQYLPLMRDPEVVEALKQLNRKARPWAMIGPHWEYEKNVKMLAKMVLNEADLAVAKVSVSKRTGRRVTKVQVPRVSLAKAEKDIRALGYRARLLEPKLNGPDGAASRRALAQSLAQLKKGIADVERAYKELGNDPLITSAIEQVAPGAALEPTDDFKNYARRVPDMERLLKTRR